MTAKQAKQHIGKSVTWLESIDPKRGGLIRSGIIREVRGKNVLIEYGSGSDWKWLPDMHQMKETKTEGALQ